MRKLLFSYPPFFFKSICQLSVVFAMMFSATDTTIAQIESTKSERISDNKNRNWRIGIYLSAYGILTHVGCTLDFSCYDDFPYPRSFNSINYKNFGIIFAWNSDQNEFLLNVAGRYNYKLLKRYRFRPFLFAEISTWYFHKKWIYRRRTNKHPDFYDCQ